MTPISPGSIRRRKLHVLVFWNFTKNHFQMMTKKRKKIRPITLIWPEFYPIWTFWLMLSYLLVSRTLGWILNGDSSRYVFTFSRYPYIHSSYVFNWYVLSRTISDLTFSLRWTTQKCWQHVWQNVIAWRPSPSPDRDLKTIRLELWSKDYYRILDYDLSTYHIIGKIPTFLRVVSDIYNCGGIRG